MPLGFRINVSGQPFSPKKRAALPSAQQILERELMRENLMGHSVAELASGSGLTEAEVIEHCDAFLHFARSPFRDATARMYYCLLVNLRMKYSITPEAPWSSDSTSSTPLQPPQKEDL